MPRSTPSPSTSSRSAASRRPGLTLLSFILLAAVACSGSSSSPTEPMSGESVLSTPYGTARVITNGCPFDPAAAVEAVEAGYAQARAQIGNEADLIGFDGAVVLLHPGTFDGAVGRYSPRQDEIEVAQGIERVLRHELQHRFCYRLGLPRDCCFYQDHPGGYDLHCNRL